MATHSEFDLMNARLDTLVTSFTAVISSLRADRAIESLSANKPDADDDSETGETVGKHPRTEDAETGETVGKHPRTEDTETGYSLMYLDAPLTHRVAPTPQLPETRDDIRLNGHTTKHSKLTFQDVIKIIHDFDSGMTPNNISTKYNASPSKIGSITGTKARAVMFADRLEIIGQYKYWNSTETCKSHRSRTNAIRQIAKETHHSYATIEEIIEPIAVAALEKLVSETWLAQYRANNPKKAASVGEQ